MPLNQVPAGCAAVIHHGGAGTVLGAGTLTRLVTDRSLAAAAGEVRSEVAAMPAPESLVNRLEALTRPARHR